MKSSNENQLDRALRHVHRLLVDGLSHGFFELTVTCEIVKDRKRKLLVKSGKSEQFTIAVDDVIEAHKTVTAVMAAPNDHDNPELATSVTQAEDPGTDHVRGPCRCGVTHGGLASAAKRPGP